ncbi:MAG: DUF3567 domain-containing protein [Burkholderiales bacterium]|nr:DUF3567 domain-containing protein [Burkholderiales bacterium]MDE2274679.1 DUF3567 domain-containing protein [Burkholderiales bacterium]
MQMLYNSDSFVVVQFDGATATDGTPAAHPHPGVAARGGFEIVDKFARKEIFLQGALADRFQQGVQALVQDSPGGVNPETLDDYIAGFTVMALMPQSPLTLH